MSHGIIEGIDAGVCGNRELYGDAWHRMPEYLNIDGLVTLEQATNVLDYTVENRELVIPGAPVVAFDADMVPIQGLTLPGTATGAYALVRTDTGDNLFPGRSVTNRFEVIQNMDILAFVWNEIVGKFKCEDEAVGIESVGTLFGGRVMFVNVLLETYRIKGDESPTMARMMISQGHGGEVASACLNTTRVVCNNTRTWAKSEAVAAGMMRRFKHTAGAQGKLENAAVELTALKAQVAEEKEVMTRLAELPVDSAYVASFLEAVIPTPTPVANADTGKVSTRGLTLAANRQKALLQCLDTSISQDDIDGLEVREVVTGMFENQDGFSAASRTRYGLFNAYTDWSDHHAETRNGDHGTALWAGLTGAGHNRKASAFDFVTADLATATA
jgi:phage/plasmid-like protein (TIGR03299 family)